MVRRAGKGKRPFRRGIREASWGVLPEKDKVLSAGDESQEEGSRPFPGASPRGGGTFLRLRAAGEGRKKTEILRAPKSCPIDGIIGAWYAI